MIDDSRKRPGCDGVMARLSRREHDILAASARGAVVVEVACELGLPEQEVRAGLASAIRKLGARSKLEAVVLALRQGLIDPRGCPGMPGHPASIGWQPVARHGGRRPGGAAGARLETGREARQAAARRPRPVHLGATALPLAAFRSLGA